MRGLGIFGVVVGAGLVSQGVLGRPVSPRIIYPYPIYRSNDPTAFDWQLSRKHLSDSQAQLGAFSAAFSKAVEVGFVNVIIRPHEHMASLLRFYKSPGHPSVSYAASHFPLIRLLVFIPSKRIGPAHSLGNLLAKRESLSDGEGESAAFQPHDYRRSEASNKVSAPSTYDRRTNRPDSLPSLVSDRQRGPEVARSSTHSTSREHLKPRLVLGVNTPKAKDN